MNVLSMSLKKTLYISHFSSLNCWPFAHLYLETSSFEQERGISARASGSGIEMFTKYVQF